MKQKPNQVTPFWVLIPIVGLSLLMYPSVSAYWNSAYSGKAISNYAEIVWTRNDPEKYDPLLAAIPRLLFCWCFCFCRSVKILQMEVKRMKKLCKRMIPFLLAMLLSATVLAAGSIDLNREVNLTISYQDGKTPLAGAVFDIYLVASVDETGELTATDAFRQFNVEIRGENDAAWRTLACTLEGYVLRDGLAPTDSGKTDRNGKLRFPTGSKKLTPGLYLVLGYRHTQDGRRYDPMPFMVMLPALDTETNEWRYDVAVNPKHDSSEIPDTPSTIIRKVLKVWDDADSSDRPAEVVVQLLQDGKVYDTVILHAGNNWRYTWSDLDDSHTWTVVEKACRGYTVQVEQDGITFVITNTRKTDVPDKPTPSTPEPTSPTLPQTGQLWWPVPFLVMGGLLLLAAGLFSRRKTGDE